LSASERRLASPPDAMRASGRGGSPGFGANVNVTRSPPPGPISIRSRPMPKLPAGRPRGGSSALTRSARSAAAATRASVSSPATRSRAARRSASCTRSRSRISSWSSSRASSAAAASPKSITSASVPPYLRFRS